MKRIDEMRVVDLRNELEKRGLDKSGVKAVLTERLKMNLEAESGSGESESCDGTVNESECLKSDEGDHCIDKSQDSQISSDQVQKDSSSEKIINDGESPSAEDNDGNICDQTENNLDEVGQGIPLECDLEEIEGLHDGTSDLTEAESGSVQNAQEELKSTDVDGNWEVNEQEEMDGEGGQDNLDQNEQHGSFNGAEEEKLDQDVKEDDVNVVNDQTMGGDSIDLLLEDDDKMLDYEENDRGADMDDSSYSGEKDGCVDSGKTDDKKDGLQKDDNKTSKESSTPRTDGSKDDESGTAKKDAVNNKNLWVSGLSSDTRAQDLKLLFSKHGKVLSAKIVTNAKTPGAKCFGFITMASEEDVEKCIANLNKSELHGRVIQLDKGVPSNSKNKKSSSSGDKSKDAQNRKYEDKKGRNAQKKSFSGSVKSENRLRLTGRLGSRGNRRESPENRRLSAKERLGIKGADHKSKSSKQEVLNMNWRNILIAGNSVAESLYSKSTKAELNKKYGFNVQFKTWSDENLAGILENLHSLVKPHHEVIVLFGITFDAWNYVPLLEDQDEPRIVYPNPNFNLESVVMNMNNFVLFCKNINPDIKIILCLPTIQDMYAYNQDRVRNTTDAPNKLLKVLTSSLTFNKKSMADNSRIIHKKVQCLMKDDYMWPDKLVFNFEDVLENINHGTGSINNGNKDVDMFLKGHANELRCFKAIGDGLHPTKFLASQFWFNFFHFCKVVNQNLGVQEPNLQMTLAFQLHKAVTGSFTSDRRAPVEQDPRVRNTMRNRVEPRSHSNPILEERERQRRRTRERLAREEQRRHKEEEGRVRQMERKQREEAERLKRERDRLRMEREEIEREKMNLLKLEREHQRFEREKLEREREEIRKQQMKYSDPRRGMKRPMGMDDRRESMDDRKRGSGRMPARTSPDRFRGNREKMASRDFDRSRGGGRRSPDRSKGYDSRRHSGRSDSNERRAGMMSRRSRSPNHYNASNMNSHENSWGPGNSMGNPQMSATALVDHLVNNQSNWNSPMPSDGAGWGNSNMGNGWPNNMMGMMRGNSNAFPMVGSNMNYHSMMNNNAKQDRFNISNYRK